MTGGWLRLAAAGLALATTVSAIAIACSVGDIDYSGKSCPCPSGWNCVAGLCTQSTQTTGSKPEGGGTKTDSGAAAIQVSNLRPEWATANVIRWTWDVVGTKENFGSYVLTVTSNDLDAGGTKAWTVSDNAELGVFDLPLPFGGVIPVVATMTDQQTPNTHYSAVLTATDSEGHVSMSNTAEAVTSVVPLSGQVTIFDGTEPTGAWALPPGSLGLTSGCGESGGPCYQFRGSADPGCLAEAAVTAGCFVNLQLGFDPILTGQVNSGTFGEAYLEFYYRYESAVPSYWSQTWLEFADSGPCDAQFCLWGLQPWTISHAQSYRRVQIPVGMLLGRAGISDAQATLAGFSTGLIEFALGGTWFAGTTVSLDRIVVLY
jgi:hypothetical protein